MIDEISQNFLGVISIMWVTISEFSWIKRKFTRLTPVMLARATRKVIRKFVQVKCNVPDFFSFTKSHYLSFGVEWSEWYRSENQAHWGGLAEESQDHQSNQGNGGWNRQGEQWWHQTAATGTADWLAGMYDLWNNLLRRGIHGKHALRKVLHRSVYFSIAVVNSVAL